MLNNSLKVRYVLLYLLGMGGIFTLMALVGGVVLRDSSVTYEELVLTTGKLSAEALHVTSDPRASDTNAFDLGVLSSACSEAETCE